MGYFTDSLLSAASLMASLDPALLEIVALSLKVSFMATVIAALLGVPGGFALATTEFPGKRGVVTILNTLLSMPTVVIGLFVYSFISRRGILGPLELLYTDKAIVIGQVLLVTPLVATFTLAAVERIDARYRKTALTLGATARQAAFVVLREARFGIMAALIAAFGRVVSEIGISMMLGGNVRGFTRTMTTAMALEYNRGDFSLAIALGIVLLSISLLLNVIFNAAQGRSGR